MILIQYMRVEAADCISTRCVVGCAGADLVAWVQKHVDCADTGTSTFTYSYLYSYSYS